MTESDWLTGTDYAAMARFAAERLSLRRRRLLAVAFCRAVVPLVSHPELLRALDVIEQSADGAATPGELDAARQRCRNLALASYEVYAREGDHPPHALSEVAWAIAFAATNPVPVADVGSRAAAAAVEARTGVVLVVPVPSAEFDAATAAQARVMCAVVREVVNPFRPTDFAPWRTDTAVALARQMYEAREFSAMPILADALQDAGCDDEEVLRHCRDASRVHARGCWVVDGVLGRE